MVGNNLTPEHLTPRELDILRGMVGGLSNAEIAARLVLSAGTIKWYVKQLYAKLDAHTRDEAIERALALGLVTPPAARPQPLTEPDAGCPLINPLPQDVSGRYVGNADKRARLTNLLEQRARLVCIYGRAGSGKTALACRALDELRLADKSRERPDGIVSLSAISTGVSLNRLLSDLARLFPDRIQAEIDALARNNDLPAVHKIGLVLEKISGRHVVVLLDNLETVQNAETGELLDPGLEQFVEMSVAQSRALTLLITSQIPLALPRAVKTWEQQVSLEEGLSPEDGVSLLRRFDPSGAAGLRDAHEAELVQLVEKLGGFPRALESVAGMLLEDPLLSLADVRQNADLLDGEISAAVVEQALAHLSPEAMRVLSALAVFGRPVYYAALSYLLAPFILDSSLRSLLGRLIRAGFIKINGTPQQFALHPIDQNYCYAQIPSGDAPEPAEPLPFTRVALHRRAALYYREQRLPRSLWLRLDDLEPQIAEFKHWVYAQAGDEGARVLLEIDRDYLWEWGYRDLLEQFYASLEGLVRDPHLVLQVARRRAWLAFFPAPRKADSEFAQLLQEARRLGFVQEEADALDDLAQTYRRGNRDLVRGIEYHRQALALYRQIGDRRGQADALGGLGAIYVQIEPEEAIDYLLQAIEIQRELGNQSSTSFLLSMLGGAYYRLGAIDRARTILEEAVQSAKASRSPEAIIRALGTLSLLAIGTGDLNRVRAYVQETAEVNRDLTGVPLSSYVVFQYCQTALYLALYKHERAARELMERVIQDLAPAQPQVSAFANGYYSLILMLSGEYSRARSVLSVSPSDLVRWSTNYFWCGVLLVKTEQTEEARAIFKQILDAGLESYLNLSPNQRRQTGMQPILATALAGLALLDNNPSPAARAAEVTRESGSFWNWNVDLFPALIDLLMQEPHGEILAPVRESLDSLPTPRGKSSSSTDN